MPEGDTIHRAAQTLSKAIGGKIIRRARSPLPAIAKGAESLAGRSIEAVEAHGKHLLIRFDDGRALHSHMRMTGSWHIYRPGEAWQKPERAARFVIETDDFVAVCFNAPVVDLVRTIPRQAEPPRAPGEAASPSGSERPPAVDVPLRSRMGRSLGGAADLERLGPDLLKEGFDKAEAMRRLRGRQGTPIGEAVLDQSAIAGIGNIYKSETLFVCRVNPFAPVDSLSDEALDKLIETARELMSKNLRPGPRITRLKTGLGGPGAGRGSRYWVYKRSGDPCLVCGSPVRMRRQGISARSTYFCPRCQGVPAAKGPR
ncbi:MAG TPA: DNA-formamidopyrimidine glycosylase family protein [Polyangiaceae bacterium]|jgi:endonuclease-8|nr:DNA-formamidopyrimidine glycosylase family protein [Polyangiaceae bacterium]